MGPVVGVIAVILIVVLLYSIRLLNGRGGATGGGWGPNRAARVQEQAKIRDGLAAREALATFATDAPPPTRPLGIVFGEDDDSAAGLLIESVTAGTAAARIGVPAGARMISVGGIATTDRATAEAAVANARAGIPLHLIWRVNDKDFRDTVIL